MTWDEIELALGTDVVEGLRSAVRQAYVAAGRRPDADAAQTALDALLMSLTAAVILKPAATHLCDARLDECCRLLRATVGAAVAGQTFN